MGWLTSVWLAISILTLIPLFSIRFQSPFIHCLPNQIKIGILLHENQYEQEIIFKWSIDQANQKSILNRTVLKGLIKKITVDDSWDAERKVCELFEEGAVAIIGPSNAQTSQHVGSICDTLEVPHFNVAIRGAIFNSRATGMDSMIGSALSRISPMGYQSTMSVHLSIPRRILIQAYLEVLQKMNWKNFVYLYEQSESLYHLQEYFVEKGLRADGMDMKIRRFDPTKPFRDEFWSLKGKNVKHIMLDVRCSNLKTVLKHAQQVSMMTEAHCYLIVCLDTQTIDLEDFKHSRSRIVWLTASDPSSASIESLAASVNGDKDIGMFPMANGIRLSPEHLETESALVHDSVETFAYTLRAVDSSQNLDLLDPASCRYLRPFPYGSSLVNYMRSTVELEGMSGLVRFSPTGQRSDFALSIMRLTESGPEKIGNWTHQLPESSLLIDSKILDYLQRGPLSSGDERDLLIVTSIKNEPYLMLKQTIKPETGNARYEGYSIDLMDELSRLVGFDYILKEVDDNKYGTYNPVEKRWNGMIREVQIGAADLAIADLSITSDREGVVDFTLPYMSTGVSILFKKPTSTNPDFFSFLSPFEQSVWIYVCGAYIGVSFLLFVVGRISPYEWADPHPCRKEDKILRNQFSLANSFWFTIAALMQQGSDLAPRSLSTRLVAAIWYFFTLIMISSYTANLAAFLTVEKVIYPIEHAEQLYNHPQKIEYGCLGNGSTHGFFNGSKPGSKLKLMLAHMKFVETNDIGKKAVEAGNYAYFMESASIEYTIERSCNLTQIGGLLDSKGYGIAIAKNSTRKRDYRTLLSVAILSLQESGVLEILKTRWWKEKRGGGACDIDDSQGGEGVKELTLNNVGGVFVVLGMGITISFILCALELFVKSCKLAKVKGTTKWAQVKRRVSFALSLRENY